MWWITLNIILITIMISGFWDGDGWRVCIIGYFYAAWFFLRGAGWNKRIQDKADSLHRNWIDSQ